MSLTWSASSPTDATGTPGVTVSRKTAMARAKELSLRAENFLYESRSSDEDARIAGLTELVSELARELYRVTARMDQVI
jgi:hypothetical protein